MNKQVLNDFIAAKTGRQALLEERRKTLENLEINIKASNISTTFQGFYYFLKRYIILFMAFALLIIGAFFFIYPNIVLEDEDFKEAVLKEYKVSYLLEAEDKFSDGLVSLIRSGDENGIDAFLAGIDNSIEVTAEQDILAFVKLLALFILFISVILWYISRLNKKLQKRNALIKQADSLSKEILLDYKKTIAEEANELDLLKRIIKENIL